MSKTQSVKINSDSSQIKNILEQQIEILIDAGSEFAPELEIRYANGDFSLFAAETLQSGSPLIQIPDRCVPRITHFELSYTDSIVCIKSCKPEATKLQRQLLSLQLSIYNLSNKIERFCSLTPRFKLGPEHSLTHMLQKLRGSPLTHRKSVNSQIDKLRKYSATNLKLQHFLYSRALVPPAKGVGRIVMPVIEFANHHPLGSAYSMSDDSCKAMLKSRQPIHGSRECYANYGGMQDAVSAVCDFHYLDESIDCSRPIPQILKFVRWGEIILDSVTPVFDNYSGIKNLPTFTRTHVGKQVRIESGVIYISLNPLEDCLVPSLEFLVGALVSDPDARPAILQQALMMTITNSRAFYIELESEVQALPDDNKYREIKLLLGRFTKFQISFFDQYLEVAILNRTHNLM